MLGISAELGYNGGMLWNMIGHSWAIEILQHHIRSGRVHHTYLFVGPKGVGKHTLALKFAQAIMCTHSPQRGDFCGECRHCVQIQGESDPDLFVLNTSEIGEGLKVGQVRELQRQLVLKPYQGEHKIALICNFQYASNSAANALLKILEEPPAHVALLLTATTAQGLQPTIVSRCELLRLRPVDKGDLVDALQERGASEPTAKKLAILSRGLPGKAILWQQDESSLERYEQRVSDMLNLLAESQVERFKYAERFRMSSGRREEMLKVRNEAAQLLDTWMFFWRDVLLRANGATERFTHSEHSEEVDEILKQINSEDVLRSLRSIEATLAAVYQFANLQMAFESLLLDLPVIQARN